VSSEYFGSVEANGVLRPGLHTNSTGTYDLGVAMASAACIHPSHRECHNILSRVYYTFY